MRIALPTFTLGLTIIVMFVSSICASFPFDYNPYSVLDYSANGERDTIQFMALDWTTDSLNVDISEEEYRESIMSFGVRRGVFNTEVPDVFVMEDKAVKALGDYFMEKYPTELMRVDALLLMIQSSVIYTSDDEVYGCNEFWAKPLETIYHMKGDCEDTAILFCSVCKYMGIDAIMLYNDTHVGSAVNVEGASGYSYVYDGKEYFSCITACNGPLPKFVGASTDDELEVYESEGNVPYCFYSIYKPIGDWVIYNVSRVFS